MNIITIQEYLKPTNLFEGSYDPIDWDIEVVEEEVFGEKEEITGEGIIFEGDNEKKDIDETIVPLEKKQETSERDKRIEEINKLFKQVNL
ncbi:MAG: hypothetical protein QW303_00525 [Nitrososphaerota archaeon]